MIEIDTIKHLNTSNGKRPLTVQLSVQKRDFLALSGPSGTGKTTTLRILAGLTKPESGSVVVNGTYWFCSKRKINIPTRKRRIGFVFQDYALFPTMTVIGNMYYAAGKNRSYVSHIIDMMDLGALKESYPGTLSGGQKQRLALARALVNNPQILLLDEPMAALDNEMRLRIQDLIADLYREFNLTILMVSHDISEIYKLSNRVALFDSNGIIKIGSPDLLTGPLSSAKFRVIGTVASVEHAATVSIITVFVGSQVNRIVVDPTDATTLIPGMQVVVSVKAFAPTISLVEPLS